MKALSFFLALALSTNLLISCNSGGSESTSAADSTSTSATDTTALATNGAGVELPIDVAASMVGWKGTKTKAGKEESHNGTVGIQSGSLYVENGKISGGTFTIDMAAMKNLDIKDPADQAKLIKHLGEADFFDVAKYPTAQFEITEVKEGADANAAGATHTITGNLTMKGKSNPVTFPAKIEGSDKNYSAAATFSVMRKDWGLTGGIFDKIFLKDNFDFSIQLKTAAAQ